MGDARKPTDIIVGGGDGSDPRTIRPTSLPRHPLPLDMLPSIEELGLIEAYKVIDFFICPICDQLMTRSTIIVKCWHSFCEDCIRDKLELRNRCPKCDKYLGKNPEEHLRLDFHLQNIRDSLFPHDEIEDNLLQVWIRHEFNNRRTNSSEAGSCSQAGEDTDNLHSGTGSGASIDASGPIKHIPSSLPPASQQEDKAQEEPVLSIEKNVVRSREISRSGNKIWINVIQSYE